MKCKLFIKLCRFTINCELQSFHFDTVSDHQVIYQEFPLMRQVTKFYFDP